jgi:glycosyltransferase involved in cell wall biosynthesis
MMRFLNTLEQQYVAATRAATRVLCNSWFSREAILRTTGANPRVCYPGVDPDYFCPDPAVAREPVVLSVGTLAPNKRHDFILEAIATIPAERRPAMEIVGYEMAYGELELGPYATTLLSLAKDRGVDLRLNKEVSDEVLRDRYRRAAVFAFAPSLEPFGIVPLEAMACGTPVVGVAEGGLRETIRNGENGLLTERDPQEFGAALDRVLCDRGLVARLGTHGREDARSTWTWKRSVDQLETHLAWAIDAQRPAVTPSG